MGATWAVVDQARDSWSDKKKEKQEAQLLQRGRSLLHAIEYFAKSLKVTQCNSK